MKRTLLLLEIETFEFYELDFWEEFDNLSFSGFEYYSEWITYKIEQKSNEKNTITN